MSSVEKSSFYFFEPKPSKFMGLSLFRSGTNYGVPDYIIILLTAVFSKTLLKSLINSINFTITIDGLGMKEAPIPSFSNCFYPNNKIDYINISFLNFPQNKAKYNRIQEAVLYLNNQKKVKLLSAREKNMKKFIEFIEKSAHLCEIQVIK